MTIAKKVEEFKKKFLCHQEEPSKKPMCYCGEERIGDGRRWCSYCKKYVSSCAHGGSVSAT